MNQINIVLQAQKILQDSSLDNKTKLKHLSKLLRSIKEIACDIQRKEVGQIINKHKEDLEALIKASDHSKKNKNNKIYRDVTLSGTEKTIGACHPITLTIDSINYFFTNFGFNALNTGPEAESVYYNFDALNFSSTHPARSVTDTFYIDNHTVLRTHTSGMQIRAMKSGVYPTKLLIPGAVYRRDNDRTHVPMFHQVEGLWLESGISFTHLYALLVNFLRYYFESQLEVRFRPSYFPFTEPSAEVDIYTNGEWLEILGCGMVHPKVLAHSPNPVSGFAFGIGIERLAMLKYKIKDIRDLYQGDIRLLRQFHSTS